MKPANHNISTGLAQASLLAALPVLWASFTSVTTAIPVVAAFILYVVLAFRFLRGDGAYFNEMESKPVASALVRVQCSCSLLKHKPVIDGAWVLLASIMMYFFALSLHEPKTVFFLHVLILFINCLWLTVQLVASNKIMCALIDEKKNRKNVMRIINTWEKYLLT